MHPVRIGLVFTHSLGHCRRILCGIKEYAETKPDWILLPIAPERATHALAAFRPAGVIAHITRVFASPVLSGKENTLGHGTWERKSRLPSWSVRAVHE
jgi:hypothetical protein